MDEVGSSLLWICCTRTSHLFTIAILAFSYQIKSLRKICCVLFSSCIDWKFQCQRQILFTFTKLFFFPSCIHSKEIIVYWTLPYKNQRLVVEWICIAALPSLLRPRMLCGHNHKSSFMNLFYYWKYLYHPSLHFSVSLQWLTHFHVAFRAICNFHYYYFLLWFPAGSCSGSLCVDCTFTSGTADGTALGYVTSFCICWTCFSNSYGLFPSLAGTNDDEIQVMRLL